MGIQYTIKKDKIKDITVNMKGLNERMVKVGAGVGNGKKEHAWLAGIHEYGCNIPVTDKMRAYLHSKGIHLKKNTTVIHIPERSFQRAGYDKNIKKVTTQTARAISSVISGSMPLDRMLDLFGEQLATAIKTYAVQLKTPKNSSWTIEEKGSDNPLVDTGNMIESIGWEVEQ